MTPSLIRKGVPLIAALVMAMLGYASHDALGGTASLAAVTVAAPAPGSIRVLYSLDAKQNDQELIALINAAQTKIYFAIYEFTLKNVADTLVAAKKRGVDVRGLVDSGESANSYDKPVIDELVAAGIPIETELHASGKGIMHIKAMVTDTAYALGSYNWTTSATKENDELLEIGTDETLRQTYETILVRLLEKYKGNAAAKAAAPNASSPASQTYVYTEAKNHIGEHASVTGTVLSAYTSKSGTVFFDYCKSYKSCSFSAVIFASDVKKFGNLSAYNNKTITVTGTISSYQGDAEIVLSDPSQISK